MDDYVLTTIDNPWNPFTHPNDWLNHDIAYGYNTNQKIAYFADTSSKMDDEMYEYELQNAMQQVIDNDILGLYIKVYKSEADKLIPLANQAYRNMLKLQVAS